MRRTSVIRPLDANWFSRTRMTTWTWLLLKGFVCGVRRVRKRGCWSRKPWNQEKFNSIVLDSLFRNFLKFFVSDESPNLETVRYGLNKSRQIKFLNQKLWIILIFQPSCLLITHKIYKKGVCLIFYLSVRIYKCCRTFIYNSPINLLFPRCQCLYKIFSTCTKHRKQFF